jgi:hypothetical protein
VADKLDQFLRPGERVVARSRLGGRDLVALTLQILVLLGVFAYGWHVLNIWIDAETNSAADAVSKLFFALSIALLCAHHWLSRSEVLVTDRRLLRRRGLIKGVTELPLSEVWRVHGLAQGSPFPICAESKSGDIIDLGGVPNPRQLGHAVAAAAGQQPPSAPAPIAQRAAAVLQTAELAGVLLGVLLAMVLLAHVIDLEQSTFVSGLALLLLVSLVVPGAVGIAVGWLIGCFAGLAYLRPLLTAEQILAAIDTNLDLPTTARRANAWTRPVRVGLAHLLYGRPPPPKSDEAEKPG